MRNHLFTARELESVVTIEAAVAAISAFFAEKIDVHDISHSISTGQLTSLSLGGGSVESVAAVYEGDWCRCNGAVVLSAPRILYVEGHRGAHGPMRFADTIDVHGQSCLYVSRREDGTLQAVFSG